MFRKIIFLFILILFFYSCESSFIDNLNPNLVAKVEKHKIYLDDIKERISKENDKIEINQSLLLYYLNEIINEIILEDEFNKLNLKITNKDLKYYKNILETLDNEDLIKYIKFEKIKAYIVRKIPPPTTKECYQYYKLNSKKYNSNKKVYLKYLYFSDEKKAYSFYEKIKYNKTNMDELVKKENLNYLFKGILNVQDIPDEIKHKINYEKENSLWLVKVENGFYIIKILKFYQDKIPFEKIKKQICQNILDKRRTDFFNKWLKKKRKELNVKIYYNKLK